MPGLEGPFVASGVDTFVFAGLVDPSSIFAHVDTPATWSQVSNDGTDHYFQQGWYQLFSYDLSGFGLEARYFERRTFVEEPDQLHMLRPTASSWCAGIRTCIFPGGQVTFWVGYY